MKDRSPSPSTDDDDEDDEEEDGGEVVAGDDSSITDAGFVEDDDEEARGDAKDIDFAPDDEDSDGSGKSQNVAALVRDNLFVKRQPLLPRTPIICGREPTATAVERKLGADWSAELSAKVIRLWKLSVAC